MSKTNTTFVGHFSGKLVSIVTRIAGKDFSSEGYVIDADDSFVYLGENEVDVFVAIPVASIKLIRMADETAEMKEFLEGVPTPEGEEFH